MEKQINADISYSLIRSKKRKKTISLSIQRNGTIAIHAPCNTPGDELDKFFASKKKWITKKLSREKAKTCKPKEFIQGEDFFYLGKSYKLDIKDSALMKQPLALSGKKFILHENHRGCAKELFIQWYKKEAGKNIAERVKVYSRKLKLFPEKLKISCAEYRWGSCSYRNVLSFTWRLIMAPYPVIDYVVVHELLHMKEKNHSRSFWTKLENIMPEYKKQRQWLKENGCLLAL